MIDLHPFDLLTIRKLLFNALPALIRATVRSRLPRLAAAIGAAMGSKSKIFENAGESGPTLKDVAELIKQGKGAY